MQKIYLVSIGHGFPSNMISNSFFESLGIDSSADWIQDRTGIESRYSVLDPDIIKRLHHKECTYLDILQNPPPGIRIQDLAIAPWEMLQKRRGVPCHPQVVLCGTSVPDWDIPANASSIANRLKLSSFCFDANSACSSFLTDVFIAKGLLESKSVSSAAIFNIERYSLRLDYTDRRSSCLFGDGAVAAYLDTTRPEKGFEVVDMEMHSDASGYESVKIPVGGTFNQNGPAVQKFAIKRTCESTESILRRNQLTIPQIQYFIGHQANLRMLQTTCSKLGVSAKQHLYNVDKFGNQGAAGGPIVLSQNWDRFQPGDYVVLTLVGSGLTWGSALLQFVG
jgi:3-oxoacyl-[acyl-carrier-protein] synthase-3